MKTTAGTIFINEIPEIPREIVDAHDTDSLVLFVGAGISKLFGCKSWVELAKELLERCFKERFLSFSEKNSISRVLDNRKVISICEKIFSEKNRVDLYYLTLKNCLRSDDKLVIEKKSLLKNLYSMSNLIVTTNIDSLFENVLKIPQDNVYYRLEDFGFSNNLPRIHDGIYHIHGCIELDEKSIIFSLKDYLTIYNEAIFTRFIDRIFSEYTVLFVGYGLEELEILEHVLGKKRSDKKHYNLRPFYSYETKLYLSEKKYYSDLGIILIPYNYDKKGYDQLIDVVENWCNSIDVISEYYPRTISLIDSMVV